MKLTLNPFKGQSTCDGCGTAIQTSNSSDDLCSDCQTAKEEDQDKPDEEHPKKP